MISFRFAMGPVLLHFQDPLEAEFRRDYFQRSRRVAQVSLIMGLFLWSAFGLLDWIMVREVVGALWLIRYGIVFPIITAVILFSTTRGFERFMQSALAVMVLSAGFGIVAMIFVAAGRDQHLYYAGLILVTIFAYTFVRLRFAEATAVSWAIVGGYELAGWAAGAPARVFVNNNFFFVTANIIGMSAGYTMEYYARRDFLQRRQLEAASAAARQQIQRIADLQRSLLPRQMPQIPGLALAVHYVTCDQAGGDLYDLVPFADGRWAILIGDVSGHGASATVVMAMTQSILRAYERPPASASELVAHLNRQLHKNLTDGFVTAFLGIYDPAKRSLAYCRAGHPPPLILSSGHSERILDAAGLPLGVRSDESYLDARLELTPGQLVLLYTDGITDAPDAEGTRFGIDGIQRVLGSCDGTAAGAVRQLVHALGQHEESLRLRDDQTILAIEAVATPAVNSQISADHPTDEISAEPPGRGASTLC